MSENIAVEEALTETVTEDQPEAVTPEVLTEEEPETGSKAGRDAAKYRKQLRETEQQLQDMTESLTAARTQILRTAATDYRVGPNTFNVAALNDAGLDQETLWGDDGQLDREQLAEQMTALHDSKPYLFTPPARLYIPNEGNSPESGRMGNDWQGAFTPER